MGKAVSTEVWAAAVWKMPIAADKLPEVAKSCDRSRQVHWSPLLVSRLQPNRWLRYVVVCTVKYKFARCSRSRFSICAQLPPNAKLMMDEASLYMHDKHSNNILLVQSDH